MKELDTCVIQGSADILNKNEVKRAIFITRDWQSCGHPKTFTNHHFFVITILVKIEIERSTMLRNNLMKSLGGQTHVFCNCSQDPLPLIVCGKYSKHKRQCMSHNCWNGEDYFCSKSRCKTRICQNFFDISSYKLFT